MFFNNIILGIALFKIRKFRFKVLKFQNEIINK